MRTVTIEKDGNNYTVNPNATGPSAGITNIITDTVPCFAFQDESHYNYAMLPIKSDGEIITDINEIPNADFIIDVNSGGGSATVIYRKDSSSMPDEGEYVSSANYRNDCDFTITDNKITLKDNYDDPIEYTVIPGDYPYKLIDRIILSGS